MWKKIKRTYNLKGRDARSTFAVTRPPSGHRNAALLVPAVHAVSPRADIFSDGNGRLAFSFTPHGTYAVSGAGTSPGGARRITIPADYAERVPYGTTEAQIVEDGGMLVLDLRQFKGAGA